MGSCLSGIGWNGRRGRARWASLLAAAGWIALSWPGTAARADEVAARPKLVAEETEIDLGLRDAVPSFEFVFHLKNMGTAPLIIKDANPTCGCTVARFDREIAPGGTGLVTAVLDATRFKGAVRKGVIVTTNDPDTPVLPLTLKVKLRQPFDVLPSSDLTFLLHQGKAAEQILTIQSNEATPIRVLSAESSLPYVQAEVVPVEAEQGHAGEGARSHQQVRISVLPGAPAVDFAATIILETNSTVRPHHTVTVKGLIQDALAVSPPRLYFDGIPTAATSLSPVERSITLIKNEGTFKLLSVEADPALHVIVTNDSAGHFCELLVRYQGGWKPGPIQGTIVLKTSDAAHPRVEVPYTGEVMP